jgi:hypothetical protein
MATKALFEGLIIDEYDRPVVVAYVGDDACYVVDDAGFKRHIPSEVVDRQVLATIQEMMTGHEGMISEQAAKMLGQDDPFSRATIESQIKNIDKQFDHLISQGLPEEQRAYMGMLGFQIRINYRGDVLDFNQPGMIADDD